MRKCEICRREIVSKRKDAIYCRNPNCRRTAHDTRKAQAAQLPPSLPEHKASVVLTFPDGSRWLMELTPLQATPPSQFPSLTQVVSTIPQISSGSVPVPPAVSLAESGTTVPSIGIAGISSELIPPAVPTSIPAPPAQPATAAEPSAASVEPAAPPSPPAESTAPMVAPTPTDLRTVELFFTDDTGRKLPLREAVFHRTSGEWRLRRYARPALGLSRYDGHGLGGVNGGRWREFYPQKSPEEFGFDRDLAVLYADDQAGRAYAADEDLLTEVLGRGWREQLREFVRGRVAGRSR